MTTSLNRKIESLITFAEKHGWTLVSSDKAPNTLEFSKPDGDKKPMKMLFFYSTGKAATTVNHPKRGRNQLFRTDVDFQMIRKLLVDPRMHTRNGYRRKR